MIVDVLSGGASAATSLGGDEPELQTLPEVPLIVTEADSSQFAAMAEALSPRNIVIEGPPGTGKSQTIINIIAAALAKGMRVLLLPRSSRHFKWLNRRLIRWLGLYSLELHSTKARKTDVYQSIGERVHAARPKAPNIEAIVEDVGEQKGVLDNYVAALHSQHGRLGGTVHDLLWHEQRLRIDLGTEAADLELLYIEHAVEYSASRLDAAARTLDGYAAIFADISRSYGSPAGHPWHGFISSGATLAERHEFLTGISAIQQVLTSFEAACGHFARATELRAELALQEWLAAITLACELVQRDPGVGADVIRRLRRGDEAKQVNVIRRLIVNIQELRAVEGRLGPTLLAALSDEERAYGELSELCGISVLGAPLGDVKLESAQSLIDHSTAMSRESRSCEVSEAVLNQMSASRRMSL